MELHHQHIRNQDFTGQDLSGQDLSHSKFFCCKFDKADLSRADCSYSTFTGCSLRDTKCTGTNFMNSQLGCMFFPRDAYGMTLTLSCKTFQGMVIATRWWWGFLFFATMMKPDTKGLSDKLITLFGAERYMHMKNLFKNREI